MTKETLRTIQLINMVRQPNPRRLALMEGPTNCNRHCNYCVVPKRWDKEKASTVEETCRQIDWLYGEGFRILNYVGGEPLAISHPLGAKIPQPIRMCPYFDGRMATEQPEERIERTAPFRTKEGLTFEEHTERVIEYATKKGMVTNLTTNGDFVDYFNVKRLKKAGLDILTFSLHSINENSLRHLVGGARMAAKEGIIPIISVVFTKDRADEITKIAEICTANGILFSTAVVQERGGGFSAVPQESNIPNQDQQRVVFDRLLKLKRKGFVRTNTKYLQDTTKYPDNSWKCDPQTDSFVHIRACGKGKVGVCSETPTDFQAGNFHLEDEAWRKTKQRLVDKCSGCLYACHYESENQDVRGDLRTYLNMLLIKSGHAGLVKALGKKALGKRFGEIKPIPLSNEEEFGIRVKKANKLLSKIQSGVNGLLASSLELGVVLPIVIGYGLIKHQSPGKTIRRYLALKSIMGS